MISEGWLRSEAYSLPLATLWTEADFIRDRVNDRMAAESILIRAAVVDVIGGGNHLSDSLKELRGE